MSLHLYLLINEYDEHVVCLNECMFSFAMYMKDFTSYYVLCFKFYISALYAYSCSWGCFPKGFCLFGSVLSPVRGSGTLQYDIKGKVAAWA